MYKFMSTLVIIGIMLTITACKANSSDSLFRTQDQIKLIGLSLPRGEFEKDGKIIESELESKGYKVQLEFADNPKVQNFQIESMINNNSSVIIVAPTDPTGLFESMESAKMYEIPIISYRTLILNSDSVEYFVTFDSYNVGIVQAKYLIDKLNLENNGGPYNIEILTTPENENFYNGIMEHLAEFIEKGQLIIRSGNMTKEKISITNSNSESSEQKMQLILDNYYNEQIILDAVLCENDYIAQGVIESLSDENVHSPIITGMGAEYKNINEILAGTQAMSVFENIYDSTKKTCEITEDIISGNIIDSNATSEFYNGIKHIPTYICETSYIDINNYEYMVENQPNNIKNEL